MGRVFGPAAYLELMTALLIGLSISFPSQAYAAPGLVAEYSFDEGTGTSVADSSGADNDGTLTGTGVTWAPQGRFGGALSFNGSSGIVTIPHSSSISLSSSFTLSSWIRPASLSGYRTILIKETTSGCSYWLQTYGAQVSAGIRAGNNCSEHLTSTANLPLNAWSYVTVVFDDVANNFKVYLNGNQVLSQTETGTIVTNSQSLVIGQTGCSSCGFERWNGLIDEMRIYNRVLSQPEIQSDMNTPAGNPQPDTTPPSAPAGVSGTATSTSEIGLTWTPSTDDVGVTGYLVHRNGNQIATVTGTNYNDSSLAPATSYSYTIAASDAAGNISDHSGALNISTLSSDITAPTVTLAQPADQATLVGTVTLSADASDPVVTGEFSSGVAGVQFLLDGAILGGEVTDSPYNASWDSALAVNGAHTLSARVRDAAGNTTTAEPITITTDNALLPMSGPLRANPSNPMYFTDDSGRAIYLTGSHTWSNLIDNGLTDPPRVFDYPAHLDFLEANGHNFFRLWGWEQVKGITYTSSPYWFNGSPFARTGPGQALDGKPRFDLTQFNQDYFDRLRQRTIEAGQRNMYVAVLLFNGWSTESKSSPGNPWLGHPMNVSNNVSGINGDPNGDNNGNEVHSLQLSTVRAIEEAYLRKVIDTVNDLDNVTYEICNECDVNSVQWQYHMISYIKNYESGLAKQHPVGMSVIWPGGSNQDVLNSPADWISPNGASVVIPNDSKVVMIDTDHFFGAEGGDRFWAWQQFMQGGNVMLMDGFGDSDYENVAHGSFNFDSPLRMSFRRNLGYIRDYADKMNLNLVRVKGSSMFSTGYGMANAAASNAEYLGYLPTGGSITINLSATPGTLTVEWFNPATGATINAGTTTGGASRLLSAPFSGDAVIYLRNSPPDTTPPAAPAGLAAADGPGSVLLSWNAATDNVGVTAYNLHRAISPGFTPTQANRIIQFSGLSHRDSVAPGTYYYVVTAQDAAGNISNPSNEAVGSSFADTQAPSVPSGLAATAVFSSQINLSWNAATDPEGALAGYQVFRDGALAGTPTTASFNDTDLSPLTAYTYTVTSFDNSNNVSAPSQPLSVTTTNTPPMPPTFIQVASREIRSGTANGVAFPSTNTAGNLIAAYVIWDNPGSVSLTDSRGNTYQSAVGPTAWGTNYRVQVLYAKNIAGGSNTVTATFSSAISAFGILYVHEYSGLDRVSPLDVATAASGSSGALNSGFVTTTNPNELLFGAAVSSNTVTSPGTGYIARSTDFGNMTEDRIVSSLGSYNATASHNGTSWAMQLVAFKAQN